MMPTRKNQFLHELAPMHVSFPGSGFTAAVKATGTIVCGTNAGATDGNSVTIGDGFGVAKTYEYDKSANGVAGSNISWAAGTTAASLATALAALIVANQPAFTVVDDLAGTLTLTHKWPGTGGNVTITKSGSGAVTAVTGMSGGLAEVATAITATTGPIKFHKCIGATHIDKIQLVNPTGLAADDTNYYVITVENATTPAVLGTWSTKTTGGNGALTANTFKTLTPGAVIETAKDDELTYTLTLHGTATLPPGRFVLHTHYIEATE